MDDNDAPETISLAILEYLLSRGSKKMTALLQDHEEYTEFAREHDSLGWDNFLEGRITSSLFTIQRDSLMKSESYMRLSTWSRQFVQ